MNRSFWNGRRVFLTGHTGFKGAWLSIWLQRLGAELTGLALEPPTEPSLFDLARVGDRMQSIIGDIREAATVEEAMRKAEPEVVIHMAAQSLVRESYERPLETYATNVMGTAHVLDSVRKVDSVRAVLIVTSDKCYENREWHRGYRESDRLGGRDPYSSSKACAEIVTSAWRDSFLRDRNVAIATARAGNVIGGGDWAKDRLIPDIVRSFVDGREARIRNPHAVRPWQHVLEPLSGYLELAERLHDDASFGGAWNFGPDDRDAKPVSWIVEHLAERWGHDTRWSVAEGSHPHEATVLKLDSSKARARLGWKPRLELANVLDGIVDWYRGWRDEADVRGLTEQAIEDYEHRETA